jgi:hypothetical protein
MKTAITIFTLFLCTLVGADDDQSSSVETDFSDGFGPWEYLDSGEWTLTEEDGNPVAGLVAAGTQRPPVRRPTAYCLLTGQVWEDVQITLRAKTLEEESVVNRDICIIFGYVDDTHYYYTHISSNSDDKFHNIIMKVSGTERQTIDLETLPEARLGNDWHTIRVTHEASGSIKVFVDDLEAPLMTAQDTDYCAGSVGFGSFDDRALFDDVSVQGRRLKPFPSSVELTLDEAEASLGFFGRKGFSYQLEQSADLANWIAAGVSRPGLNAPIAFPLGSISEFSRILAHLPRLP